MTLNFVSPNSIRDMNVIFIDNILDPTTRQVCCSGKIWKTIATSCYNSKLNEGHDCLFIFLSLAIDFFKGES